MIIKANVSDAPAVAGLAAKMWQSHSVAELSEDFEGIIGSQDSAVFLCMDGAQAVGFAQCGLRHDYVEGTQSSPVGYLEGIFLEEAYRKQGHARALIGRCEQWAKEQGCLEFASDCEITNHDSLQFHLRCGFTEANRIICFTKTLSNVMDK